MTAGAEPTARIRTPDQKLRVFVSSTLNELAPEREAVRAAVDRLRFMPVMFELGARPHAPRDLYRAYLTQSDVFVGVYWQAYGWVAPGETASGVEDEYERAAALPKLVYVKSPAPDDRHPRLEQFLARIRADDHASYKVFSTPDELRRLVEDDIAVLLSERFDATRSQDHGGEAVTAARPLPLPPTPIVGRVREVDTVARLMLRERVRLVTLTGPGGVGKSRLALEVAAQLGPSFADGVVLSELASVAVPDDVAVAVAAALGARRPGRRSAVEDLRIHLRDRRMLLVIDNFEHVTDAAPLVAEMLSAAPGLSVIASAERHSDSGESTRSPYPRFRCLPRRVQTSSACRSTTRCACSSSEPGPPTRASSSTRRTPRPSPRSPGGSTACPSPSSWRPRG